MWLELQTVSSSRGVPNLEVDLYTTLCTHIYTVVGVADTVLIREVPLIWSVCYRHVPLY